VNQPTVAVRIVESRAFLQASQKTKLNVGHSVIVLMGF
jgi:hypothetical protein